VIRPVERERKLVDILQYSLKPWTSSHCPLRDDEQSTGTRTGVIFHRSRRGSTGQEKREGTHGIIFRTYVNVGEGSSSLSFQTSDEEPNGQNARVQYFDHGRVDWSPDETVGRYLWMTNQGHDDDLIILFMS
jgi:hypothetical protein